MARKSPRRRTKSNRLRRLIAEQDGKCFYCHVEMVTVAGQSHPSRATIDHKFPTARGGSNRMENCVAACFACNNLKGHLTDEEFIGLFPNGCRAEVGSQIRARVGSNASFLRGSTVATLSPPAPPLPDNLKFIDGIEGVVVEQAQNIGMPYRVSMPNGAEYLFYSTTGAWTRIGSFVWTKGFRAAEKFEKEIRCMSELMPMLLRESGQ